MDITTTTLKQMSACGVEQPKFDPWARTYRDTSKDPIRLKFDAIALSCCVWRVQQNGGPEHWSFMSDDIIPHLTDEDVARADAVRKYYGKKFMWDNLNGKRLSQFRQELLTVIHSEDPTIVSDSIAGLIYRLPTFYQEDLTMDMLKETANVSEIVRDELPNIGDVIELTPLDVIVRKSKQSDSRFYWMKMPNNRLVSLEIRTPNPLEHMWVDIFNNSATIKVKGRFNPAYRDKFHFYRITNWTLEK